MDRVPKRLLSDPDNARASPKSARQVAVVCSFDVCLCADRLERLRVRDAADSTEDSRAVNYVLTVLHASWYCLMAFLVELPGCLSFQPMSARAETRENLAFAVRRSGQSCSAGDSKVSLCPCVCGRQTWAAAAILKASRRDSNSRAAGYSIECKGECGHIA